MTLQQLTYFLAAIEQGTFSRAAEALNIAQPTLSEQILKLENTLGTRVFIRTSRRPRRPRQVRGLHIVRIKRDAVRQHHVCAASPRSINLSILESID